MAKSKMWYNNNEFRVLIAALDMFWTKFPESTGAKLRVCTLNSRFKDCSTISELRHLTQVSCLKLNDIMQYVFSSRIRDEILSLSRPDEEITKEDSYFPYMRELRLSKKSPYSSSQNVHLHNWISIFCALLGSEKSFNARIVSEHGLTMSLGLAIFAAHAFKKYAKPLVVFGDRQRAEEAKMIADIDGSDSKGEFAIDDASPMGVYKLMLDNGNVVPDHIMSQAADLIGRMGAPRDKTIGKFLKTNLIV